MSEDEINLWNLLNLFFTLIFTLELIIKLIGLGFKFYFHELSNTFDFIIVIISFVEIITDFFVDGDNIKILTGLRSIRLLRVFKIAKYWEQF
jgi:hypothetical protein